jgi:peptide/nickel transport system ATP-binding protein/oligopeptide transport system ATP-binding protein
MPILEVSHLKKYFPLKSAFGRAAQYIKAVDDVSFTLEAGETYGLIGETGCGKSSVGRSILKLIRPTGGKIFFEGRDITGLDEEAMRPYRRKMQMVFQDPYTSLDPRQRAGDILKEALAIHRLGSDREREKAAMDMLDKAGLQPQHFYRFPHELSGGQRQRVSLARALILNPSLVVCDEPVSALDVSVQSQILNLLADLQREGNTAYLFIAHNIGVVKFIAGRIGVMYLGVLVEEAGTEDLFAAPSHPYTQALLSAVPVPVPRGRKKRGALKGEIPSPVNTPKGCVFFSRCPESEEICGEFRPALREINSGHFAACRRRGKGV